MEEKNITDPHTCLSVIAKAHDLLEKLICTKEYEDLNVLGKSLLSGKHSNKKNLYYYYY